MQKNKLVIKKFGLVKLQNKRIAITVCEEEQKEFISQYRKNTLKYLHENKLLIDYICNKELLKVN